MKTLAISFFVFALFFIIVPITNSVFGATLKFDPATVATASGQTVTVNVNLDPASATVKGAEAFVTFDSNLLQVQSITNGNLFKTFQKDSAAGKAYLAGIASSTTDVVTTQGTLGTITFQTLTNGTATVEFYCDATNKKGSSIIQNDSSNTNIIDCASNGTSAVTIGTGIDASPTPTSGVEPTGIPTPSVLPKTGIFENVTKFAVPGAILLFVGTVARLLL